MADLGSAGLGSAQLGSYVLGYAPLLLAQLWNEQGSPGLSFVALGLAWLGSAELGPSWLIGRVG